MGGGGGKPANPTGAMPWWVRKAHQNLVGRAEEFAYGDRGQWKPYPDQRIAGLTGQEKQAIEARQKFFDKGDRYGDLAKKQLDYGSSLVPKLEKVGNTEFTTEEMNRRMNPFIDGVVNPQLREANLAYNRRLNQDEANSVARGGSIGGYRVGLENQLLEARRAQTLGDIRGKGQYDAYGQALGSFQADRQAKLASLRDSISLAGSNASAYDTLGSNSQNRELSRIAELDRSGAIQRELQQRELDLGYADFVEERDFPMQRMQFLSGILTGVPGKLGGGVGQPQPGLASQLAGLGLSAAAIGNLVGKG